MVREKLLYDVLGQPTLKAAKQALLGMDDALAAKLKLYSCTLGKVGLFWLKRGIC